MNIWKILSTLVKPVTELIDNVHTSEEEKLQIKAELFSMQSAIAHKQMEYESELLAAKSKIIVAEASGQSWLQRCWRPITMLILVGLVTAHWLGYTAENLSEAEVLSLLGIVKLGLGGYIAGRSAEKVMPKIAEAMKRG